MPLTPAPRLTNTTASNTEASGHWYELLPNGKTVPLYPEGGVFGMRQARVLHKEGRCIMPSVTTYFKELHKGYLHDVWMPQQCVKAAWDNPELQHKDDWLKKVKAIAFQQTDDAATYGTAVHKALEEWFMDGTVSAEYHAIVKAVQELFDDNGWVADRLEHCVSNPEVGYAGMCDVIGNTIDGQPLVVDFKTRKSKPGLSFGKYNTDVAQIAGYGVAHFGWDFLEKGVGANVLISTTEEGRIGANIHKNKDMHRHYEAFRGLCSYWQWTNNYFPNVK